MKYNFSEKELINGINSCCTLKEFMEKHKDMDVYIRYKKMEYLYDGIYFYDKVSVVNTCKELYGDKVDVSGVPCLGLCSIDWEFSKAPYVKVDDEVIKEATVEKVLKAIEEKLKA